MINTNRVIPVEKIDFLSLIGTILTLNSTSYNVLHSSDVEGTFAITASGSAGNFLADQPVKSLDFGSATAATVYFTADLDFEGMKSGDTAADISDVKKDGITLYKAVLSGGSITITAVTP